MSEEKQIEEKVIEEMAKVIEITEQVARDAHCGLPSPRMYAKDLYWHGYRKQSEGEWIQQERPYEDEIVCSVCGANFNIIDNCTEKFNHCPNCGAKMKGGAG